MQLICVKKIEDFTLNKSYVKIIIIPVKNLIRLKSAHQHQKSLKTLANLTYLMLYNEGYLEQQTQSKEFLQNFDFCSF